MSSKPLSDDTNTPPDTSGGGDVATDTSVPVPVTTEATPAATVDAHDDTAPVPSSTSAKLDSAPAATAAPATAAKNTRNSEEEEEDGAIEMAPLGNKQSKNDNNNSNATAVANTSTALVPGFAAAAPAQVLPDLTIAYCSASVSINVTRASQEVQTVFSPFVNVFSAAYSAITGRGAHSKETFYRVHNATGRIKPGTMTMVLAPPGQGKSSFLRMLAQRLPLDENTPNPNVDSESAHANSVVEDAGACGVRYNGLSAPQAEAQGCSVRRLCHFVEQVDEHLPLLTVRETLDFANRCTSATPSTARVDQVIALLGLEECENTILGNALIRGVSGGQKRRVTVGEMLVGDARAVFLDEYSNGLDTATAEDLTRGLRAWTRATNGSVVTTLQQPTPGLFACYDEIIILNNSEVLYHGPRVDVVPFFASMGFKCPDDVDVCDFVIDCVSQPRTALQRLQLHSKRQRRNKAKAKAKGANTGKYTAAVAAAAAAADGDDDDDDEDKDKGVQSSLGLLAYAPAPCVTSALMVAHYQSTVFYWRQLNDIKPYFTGVAVADTHPSLEHANNNNNRAVVEVNSARAAAAAAAPLGINSLLLPLNEDALSKAHANAATHKPAADADAGEHVFTSLRGAPVSEATKRFSTGYRQPVSSLLGMVLKRQGQIVVRNKGLIMPRLMQAVVMGLINGSLYWQIPPESFFLRTAVLLIAIAQVGFANMVEMPISVQNTRIVYRQSASGFYPPYLYIIAASIMSIPLFAAECLLLASVMYWMSGCYPGGAEFMTFYCLLLVQSFNIAILFRFLASSVKNEAAAQSIAGPIVGICMLLAGFFVNESAMPIFMRWLLWLSPFNWTLRALTNNEFLSARYDDISDTGMRVGNLYLKTLQIRIGYEWIGYAVLFLFGLAFIFIIGHAIISWRPYYEASIGTRRVEEAEVLATQQEQEQEQQEQAAREQGLDDDNAALAALAIAQYSQGDNIANNVEDNGPEYSVSLGGAAVATGAGADAGGDNERDRGYSVSSAGSMDGSSSNLGGLKTLREAAPFTPLWLSFRNIRYTVQVKTTDGSNTTVDRPLLRGVNGYAEPGKLTALMGASGAGKTTLLDVLAGRKNTGVIEGSIQFNGRVPSAADVAYHTGYVEQFDSLFPFDTVRETLLFAARLRLPNSVSEANKQAIVDEVMDILELTPLQDLIIGNATLLGLSPSQLKRVNIGCELVANPAILFLDEPTTGLDSRAAQTVMRVVRRIARSGRSVICTIHQPSAELFYLFDRLVLLASGGHQVFFGSLGARCRSFIPYIEAIPRASKCPPRYNPSSWMLEEMGVGQANAAKALNKNNSNNNAADSGNDDSDVTGTVLTEAEMAKMGRFDPAKVLIERFVTAWRGSKQYSRAIALLDKLDAISGSNDGAQGNQSPLDDIDNNNESFPTVISGRELAEAEAEAAAAAAAVSITGAGVASGAGGAGGINLEPLFSTLITGVAPSITAPVVDATATHGHSDAPAAGRARSGSNASVASHASSMHAPLPAANTADSLAAAQGKDAPSLGYQFWQVLRRMIVGYYRNPPVLAMRVFVVTLLSLIFGLIYFDLTPNSQSTTIALLSVLSVSTLFGAVNHAGSSTPNLMLNRVVLYREQASQMYSAWMWGLAGFMTEAFYAIFTAFLVQIPTYFMAGLDPAPAVFFRHYFAVYVIILCYLSLSTLLSSATPNMAVAGVGQGIFFGLLNTFSGIANPLPSIPRGWVWFFRMLPSSHASEALVMSQVGTCTPLPNCGPLITVVKGTQTVQVHLAAFVSDYLGFVFGSWGHAIGWMFLWIVVLQTLGLIAITKLNFSSR